jgi:prepilin-type processing-associated H-X9-DG protein
LLPFLEESSARALPGDGQAGVITDQQRAGAARLIEQAFEVFNCPSRRAPAAYPTDFEARELSNAYITETSGKLDYAINAGDLEYVSPGPGPRLMTEYEWDSYRCCTDTGRLISLSNRLESRLTGEFGYNGISFEGSEVSVRHVADGTASTYLIGEKYLSSDNYATNVDWGDNRAWCMFDDTAFRTAFYVPRQDTAGYLQSDDIRRLNVGGLDRSIFGSAHSAGMHMAYCDGSVRVVNYDIEQIVHMAGANRHDGTIHGKGATLREPAPPPAPRPPPRR